MTKNKTKRAKKERFQIFNLVIWISAFALLIIASIIFFVIGCLLLSNPVLFRDFCDNSYQGNITEINNVTLILHVQIIETNKIVNVDYGSQENSDLNHNYFIGKIITVYQDCNEGKKSYYYLTDVRKKISRGPWIIMIICCVFILSSGIYFLYKNIPKV